MIQRGPRTTFFPLADGNTLVVEYRPRICYRLGGGIYEIGWRGFWYSVGFMWGYVPGCWSRMKMKFLTIGKLTLYVHYGETVPYNPLTGEVYSE